MATTTKTLTLKLYPSSLTRQTLTVAAGDYGYQIPFVVQDADGNAKDLTGYTVTLHTWQSLVPGTYVINEACTVDVEASGTCHYNIASGDISSAGQWVGELELTKAGAVESTETFELVAVNTSSLYCTLGEVKAALDITGDQEDSLLYKLMSVAKRAIDNHCRRTFNTTTEARYFDGVADKLHVPDLLSVTSLKTDTDGDGVYETTFASTDYLLYPYDEPPYWKVQLSEASAQSNFATGKRQAVEITGTWGYATSVPDDIQLIAIMQAARLYRLSKGGFGTEIGAPEIGVQTIYQGLPSDAKRLLDPYVKHTYE